MNMLQQSLAICLWCVGMGSQKESISKIRFKQEIHQTQQTFRQTRTNDDFLAQSLCFQSKLPFSEHAAPNPGPVIRLPFPTKVLVHKVYKNQLRPLKNVLKPLDFPRFTSVWKNSLELSHIKCSKYKPGFSKCDVCKEYETNKLKKITPCEYEILDSNFLKF